MNRVNLHDVPSAPWRNGGGQTRELLAWPAAPDWLLRVSVADVTQAGPFSAFAGVQRWFAVLSGAGVRLRLPGGVATVREHGEALCFDGAAAPDCELIDGPTRDLNFMLRGDTARGSLGRARQRSQLAGTLRWRGLFALGEAQLAIDGTEAALPAGTLLWSDAAEPSTWTLLRGERAWWLALLP
jgi:uncharacterized protein